MKTVSSVGVCGLLLAACCLAPTVAAGERVLEKELPAGDLRRIVVNAGNGSARIVPGDEQAISIRVALRPEKLSDTKPWSGIKKWFLTSAYDDVDDLIEAIRLRADSSDGDKLTIALAPPKRTRDSKVREDWQITIPKGLAVRLAMARADATVTGVAGGVDLSIGNGSADVDVPGGDLDIDVTVGRAAVRTGSRAVGKLTLESQVGDTKLWMNGLRVDYSDPPGPGSRISMSGKGKDTVQVSVQVGDASLRVNEP